MSLKSNKQISCMNVMLRHSTRNKSEQECMQNCSVVFFLVFFLFYAISIETLKCDVSPFSVENGLLH